MNPYREKAIKAREYANRLAGPTSSEIAMRQAFPLGAGFGHGSRRSREKSMDARIDRAGKAIAAAARASRLEAMADAWDNPPPPRPMTKKEEKNQKARNAVEARKERQRAAQEKLMRLGLLGIDADTYADSCGTFGGSARGLMKYDYEQKIAALKSTTPTPARPEGPRGIHNNTQGGNHEQRT